MFSKFKILIFFMLVFSQTILAQNYSRKISHINVKNGLSHNNVYAVTQDKLGFIWIGTQNGLDKFDGYNFLSYYHDPEDSTSLISANFGKLFTDSKNRIWIGTYTGGLSCYIPEKNSIKHFVHDKKNPKSISNDLIRFIGEDKEGNIWISTHNGLNKFIEKDFSFKKYFNNPADDNSLSSSILTELSFDDDGSIWVATINGLNKFDPKTETAERFYHNPNNNNSLSSNSIQSIFIDNEGNLWIGTRDAGLNILDRYSGKITRFDNDTKNPKNVGDTRIQCIFQDSYGTVWVGTYTNGLSIYDPFTSTFSHVVNITEEHESLSSNTIEAIFEDNSGNLWIGTRGGGLNIIDLKPQKFYNIEPKPKDNTLPDPVIQAIIQQNDSIIWFGTKAGLSKYNLYTNKYTNFKQADKPNSLNNDYIRALAIDNKNNIWVGTYYGGVSKISFSGKTYKITSYTSNPENQNSILSNLTNTLLFDNKNNLWIGTNNGLSKLTETADGQTFTENYKHLSNNPETISNTYVSYIYQDKKNNIWICTSSGLDKYRPETNSFIRFANKGSTKSDLDVNSFTCIFQDSENNYWTGTNGGGLYKFNPEKGSFTLISDGTSNTGSVMGIVEDNEKNLWISTQKGISKYSIRQNVFVNYDISDGLSESGFNRNAVIKTNSGDLYFGNISGYTIIKPEQIKTNSNKPKVVLVDFKIFNKSVFKNKNSFASKNPAFTNQINLTYNDYVVSFDFAALDFTNPLKNKYAYKLQGFNKNWIELGNMHNIMLTNLPPGNYILTVKAANNDGIWCDETDMLKIKIYVKPPFWKTWWFYSILTIMAFLGVYIYTLIRTKNYRKKNEILEAKVKKRTLQLEETNKELEKLSVVARQTDNSVTIIDPEGKLLWINEGFTKIFGYKNIEDFTEKMGENIITGNFSEDIVNSVKEVISKKKTIISKAKVSDKYGRYKWLQTVWTPVLDSENNLRQIISVDSDITEIINAEEEIIKQKNILEEKNSEINRYNENLNSSIRYAQTIQESILPAKKQFNFASENFIIYIPKDIVSGDFYWYAETDDYHFVGVVDCTGHGVPGAFMSLIGSRLLNKIVKDNNVADPSEILEFLDSFVVSTLKQHETGNRDGMDAGILRINKKNEGEFTNAIFAGAKQDLIFYQNSENKIYRIRGTRREIGGTASKRNKLIFDNSEINLKKGDTVYLMSDGYTDQNNKNRERFGTSRFMMMLEQTAKLNLENQKQIITDILEKFKDGEKNRDDITILALKL